MTDIPTPVAEFRERELRKYAIELAVRYNHEDHTSLADIIFKYISERRNSSVG